VWDQIARCLAGQGGHHPELDAKQLEEIAAGAIPNLVLWNGRVHQLALSFKHDYLPFYIRREAEGR
jgi:hypothetical protein